MSGMYLIPPMGINDATLLASNIPEDDYPPWISNSPLLAIGGRDSAPAGVCFNAAKTKAYFLGLTSRTIYQYNLSTPGNVLTGVYASKSMYVGGQDSLPSAIAMSADDAQIIVLGRTNKTAYQYTLSTPGDLATGAYASKSLSVNAQEPTPFGLALSADNLQMLIVGTTNKAIRQFTLRAAADLSTGAYIVSFAATITIDTPGVLTATAHNLVNGRAITLATTGALPTGYALSTTYYVINAAANTLQLSLTRGGGAINTSGSQSGTHTVTTVAMSLLVSAQDASPQGLAISVGGDQVYMLGAVSKTAYQYTLTTALDILTASYANKSLLVGTEDSTPNGIWMDSGSDYLYMVGAVSKAVYQYTVTAGDISTGVYPKSSYALADRVTVINPSLIISISIANPAVIAWSAHGLTNGTPFTLATTGGLPTGATTVATYYVRDADNDKFCFSSVQNGAALVTSGTQSGVHTATAQVHQIFESLADGNSNFYPLSNTAWWTLVGATNRHRMFDRSLSLQSAQADVITATLQVTNLAPSVSLFNLYATTARITMSDIATDFAATVTIDSPGVWTKTAHGLLNGDKITLSTTGLLPTGYVVYTPYFIVNKTADTFQLSLTSGDAAINTSGSQSGIHTVYSVVFDTSYTLVTGSVRKTDIVELGLPQTYLNSIITVTLNATGETVLCGETVIGEAFYIGDLEFGAALGIVDYSVKTVDRWGTYEFSEGVYANRGNFTVEVAAGSVDNLRNVLASRRAIPTVYVGTTQYSSTLILGRYLDFEIHISGINTATLNIQLESLSGGVASASSSAGGIDLSLYATLPFLSATYATLANLASNLANLASSIGSSLVGYLAAGIGAVVRTVQSKLHQDLPSVFDYMTAAEIEDVVANTGSIDVTAKFVLAHNASKAFSVPAGTYLLDNYRPVGGEVWHCAGTNNTMIKQKTAGQYALNITSDITVGQLIGNSHTGFGVIGATSATVAAVNVQCAGVYAIRDMDLDFVATNTYSPLRMSGVATYRSKITVESAGSEHRVLSEGSYNEYDFFITGCTGDTHAILDTSNASLFKRVITEGAQEYVGSNCTIINPKIELWTSVAHSLGIYSAGTDNVLINPELILVPAASCETAFAQNSNNGTWLEPRITGTAPATAPYYPLSIQAGGAATFINFVNGIGSYKIEQTIAASTIATHRFIGGAGLSYESAYFPSPSNSPPNDLGTAATYTVDASMGSFGMDYFMYSSSSAGLTLTLPSGAEYAGRKLHICTRTAQTVISASSNVIPMDSAAGTPILAATVGKWAILQADATAANWWIIANN